MIRSLFRPATKGLTTDQLRAQLAVLDQILAEARAARAAHQEAMRSKFWDKPVTSEGM